MDVPTPPLDERALRALVPRVLAGLVRRGEDFDAAEDALQEALLEALRVWPAHPPDDPRAWLTTVAARRLVDARRSEAARQRREEAVAAEPRAGAEDGIPIEGDDTLFLLFCCCHPGLAPASQVALTLRISRAKRTLTGPSARPLDRPGDLAGRAARALPRLHRRARRPVASRRPGRRGDPAPRPGCARPNGCATCSATAIAGTRSAATGTSWAATCRSPTSPPAGRRTAACATRPANGCSPRSTTSPV